MECKWCGMGSAKYKVKRLYFPFKLGIIGFHFGKKNTMYVCESCIVSIAKPWIDSTHKMEIEIMEYK